MQLATRHLLLTTTSCAPLSAHHSPTAAHHLLASCTADGPTDLKVPANVSGSVAKVALSRAYDDVDLVKELAPHAHAAVIEVGDVAGKYDSYRYVGLLPPASMTPTAT